VGVALLLVDGVALLYGGLYGLVVCAVTGGAAGYVWLVLEPMRRLIPETTKQAPDLDPAAGEPGRSEA
jgi:hypothetical protein